MQVTTARAGGESGRTFRLEVSRAAGWRAFIAAAHGRGLQVEALDGDPTYADAAFHYVPLAIADGERVHLGVTIPAAEIDRPAPLELVQIARDFGAARPEPAAGVPAAAALARSGEWVDVRPAPIADPDTGVRYDGFIATSVPQAKLTCATRPAAFQQETSAADRAFRQFAQYRGMAVHDYEGLRALMPAR